ncbi:MAG: hypothetical protein Q7U86_09765, partial [Draconibacterium sp.]|nr:hypothetical protein [Draconibacterium sp.]
MDIKKYVLFYLLLNIFSVNAQNEVIIQPKEYVGALRNPMMGFTTNGIKDHPWGSLAFSYLRWNELENNESDGINKIINVCNQKWGNVASKNVKVIPRVYLHWDGEQKYWPSDMQKDD